MVDAPAVRSGGGPGGGGSVRVRPQSDGPRPLCDDGFSGHGVFLFRLRALGGVPGGSESATIAYGRGDNRTGADHEVLRRAADSTAGDSVRGLLDPAAEGVSGAPRGHRRLHRDGHRSPHGGGGLPVSYTHLTLPTNRE